MIILCFFSISASCASEVNNDINIETLSDNVESTNLNGTQSGVVHSIDNESVTFVDNSVNDSSNLINDSDDKNNASLTVPDTEIAQGKSESFNITLTDNNTGSPLSNQTVSFIVNNIAYNRTTDDNGIAGLTIRLSQGNYSMTYFFLGNDNYNSISGSCTLKVIPVKDTTVSPISSDVFRGQTLNINLSSEDGPISNQTVYITVNGKTYSRITDENGIAKLTIRLSAGYYTVNYSYNGSRFFNPFNGESEVNVIDGTYVTNMTVVNSTVVQGSSFKVNLTNIYGVIIPNETVLFTVNGVSYNRTTNENGIAQLNINLGVGYYTITYEFNGNDLYNSSNGSTNLSVVPKENTQLIALNSTVNQGNYYEVILRDSNNNPIVNQTVTIQINGKNYNRTTDSEGKVRLTLRLNFGYYEVISTYNGNSQYNDAVLYDNVFVLNSSKTNTIISVENFVKNSTENKTMEIHVTDINGTPLAGEEINLTINGKTYTRTTNENGTAYITIRLNTGLYDVQIVYYGNNEYNPSMAYNNILSNGTFLIASDLSMGYKDGSQFVVTLLNATRDPIVGEKVYITINGVTYTRTTDSEGIARLNINLRNDTYNVTYSYLGSEKYPSNEGNNLVVVENRMDLDTIIDNVVSEVYPYIVQNHELPGGITINGVVYSVEEYMYILASAIVNINAGSPDYVVLHSVLSGSYEESVGEGNLALSEYLALASEIINDVNNGNPIGSTYSGSIGDMSFDRILYGFTKVISQYANDGSLPELMVVSSLVKTYDTSTIEGMAGYLTDGLVSEYDKAVALFNWVRSEITYQYYSNSLKGASGAFTSGSANCCDQANLLVEMARYVGLTIQYRHCTSCYFYLDGAYYGHVWTQFIIDGEVYQADPVSTRNSFGVIVNFNYNDVVGNTRTYNDLPF